LRDLPLLRLLQVGSYCFSKESQVDLTTKIAILLPTLKALAVNGDDNDTTWWGIWRDAQAIEIRPLAEGDLRKLESGMNDYVPATGACGSVDATP
jgi:hypothetical protein